MKVGANVTMINPAESTRSDDEVYQDELSLIDLVEPLGFDSLMCVEHHFTGFAMIPNNLQLLAYVAGRTKRIQLVTDVIVLPWREPIRVAEEIATLDVLCGGRTIFGFGRGAAPVEYDGFGVPMAESRERFKEAAEIVIKGITQERFSYHGKHFNIPEIAIRPRPVSHPERRFYAASISPESAEIMAKLGFGVFIIAQKDWDSARADLDRYSATARSVGLTPRPPICTCNVLVGDDHAEIWDRGHTYFGSMFKSINSHYGFTQGRLQGLKDFEFHARFEKTFAKLTTDSAAEAKALDYFMKLHVVGTPRECLEQLEVIHKKMGMEHLGVGFSFGGMPRAEVERSMRLFADKILPVLHHDPAFAAAESYT
jgi:alkanesulfonate monooxygenase SsuD/methylene tetrahydromethanopterin reductase-like flavin-dependent oxidoreductase (luciferase family)